MKYRISDQASATSQIISEEFNNLVLGKLAIALAEELQAWYQYWIVAKFMVGSQRQNIELLFDKNADDELNDHANKIRERINELGGNVDLVNNPNSWAVIAGCKYLAPNQPYDVRALLEQNIKSEECAIKTYTELCNITRDKDLVTYKMSRDILADEEEHLTALREFVDDLNATRVTDSDDIIPIPVGNVYGFTKEELITEIKKLQNYMQDDPNYGWPLSKLVLKGFARDYTKSELLKLYRWLVEFWEQEFRK